MLMPFACLDGYELSYELNTFVVSHIIFLYVNKFNFIPNLQHCSTCILFISDTLSLDFN